MGLALKDFVIRPIFCCLEFSTISVCLWAAGGKIEKEVKFQSSQVSGLNRTLSEGRHKPGERSVTPASTLSFKTENLCMQGLEGTLVVIIPKHENEI